VFPAERALVRRDTHRLFFLFAATVDLHNHFLFHLVDVALLLLKALARLLNVLLQVDKLLNVQVAVLRFLLELGLLLICALTSPLDLLLQVFFALLLVQVVGSIFLGCALFLKHLIDHVTDVARLILLFDYGPLLHDSILQLYLERVLAELPLVSF